MPSYGHSQNSPSGQQTPSEPTRCIKCMGVYKNFSTRLIAKAIIPRLSCCSFAANAVRLQLHALAYNLANFMRTLALPETVKHWSLTSLREKLVKIFPCSPLSRDRTSLALRRSRRPPWSQRSYLPCW